MADYCYTKFTITGEREKLNELFNLCFSKGKLHDTYYFDFEKIIPSPKTKEDCHPRYYLKPGMHIQPEPHRPWFNWYLWNNIHWGTKWNSTETDYNFKNEKTFIIEITTAWQTPEPIIMKFCQISAKLHLNVKYRLTSDYDDKVINESSPFNDNFDDPNIYKDINIDDYIDDEEENNNDDFEDIVKKNK